MPKRFISPSLLLVGGGMMGASLVEGWLKAGLAGDNIYICEPDPSPALRESIGKNCHLNPSKEVLSKSSFDFVFFAIKPQHAEIISQYKALASNAVFVSILAGISLDRLEGYTPAQWVRVMPNIPASVGQAMSVAAVKQELNAAQKEILQFLLEAVGMLSWAEEADMDAATAISGSGPAYVFYLAECLAQAGEGLGLSSEQASQYARQTIIGAGEMLRLSSTTPAQLRENVTSPQGTTEAALRVFMEGEGLKKLMEKATKAAAKRSQELRGK